MEKGNVQQQAYDAPGGGSGGANDLESENNGSIIASTEQQIINDKDNASAEDADDDDDDEDEEEFPDDLLLERRQLITELIRTSNNGNEGDVMYLIPADYLTKFLNEDVPGFEELKISLGEIDCICVVDSNGRLYLENEEPVGTYNIVPEIFNHLSTWFGIIGEPVTRRIIIDELGSKEVERFPPTFHLHLLGKKPTTYRQIHHQETPIPRITVSKTSTFQDLLDVIRVTFLKVPANKITYRVWFMESQTELPAAISINSFVYELSNKSLVHPGILKETLKSQGVNAATFHLLVETIDKKSSAHFPIDNFVAQVDTEMYDIDSQKGGNLGLNNLGNTCYMNSALQCLLHIPEINHYFFYNLYKKELNFDNPLGNHGDVANSFGNLLKQSFEINAKGVSCVSPREFKSTIGRYSSMFSGCMQQDSQEFLSWLLDALHEDLNRIKRKPYSEKPELKDEDINDPTAITRLAEISWDQHRQRNDSVIVDLFTGLYQSTLVCPSCGKTSVTFDPFNDLTLPLPISKKWYHSFTIIDLSEENIFKTESKIIKFEVELNKNSNYDDLVKYLAKYFKVDTSQLFLYEVFRNSFHCDFQLEYNRNKFLPIGDIIKDADDVFVYYIPHNPVTDMIVPVLNAVEDPDKSYKITDLFGIPLFVVLNKETDLVSFGTIRKKLEGLAKILTRSDISGQYEAILTNSENYTRRKFYSTKDFPVLSKPSSVENDDLDTEDSGYDSDISLANPYIDVTFGFTVKYSNESRLSYRPKFSHTKKTEKRFINVPLHRPQARDFSDLANYLPALKRNYYHYPSYNKRLESEMEQLANEVDEDMARVQEDESDESKLDASDSKSESDGFVLVAYGPKGRQTSAQPSSSDEDTEAEQALGSLFDENPAVDMLQSDSVKPSNVNSPVEEESVDSPTTDNHPTLVSKETVLLCDWKTEIHQEFFAEESKQAWLNVPLISNPELERNKVRFEKQRNTKISLLECLRSFSVPEVLGEHDLWYCPSCLDHKQATKTIQIWSTGDILTIHLKRFHSARAFSDKIDMVIDFPIEGLDVSEFVSNQLSDNIYDLIGVDNHYGGLGGGHYTAYVKNFRDEKWYYFDDSRVVERDPKESITGAAYLLFYRKRSSKALGGTDLSSVLEKGRGAFKQNLAKKKEYLEQITAQTADYQRAAETIRKETALDRELKEKLSGTNDKVSEEEELSTKKTKRLVKTVPVTAPQFNLELDLDSDYLDKSDAGSDGELSNSRKQRLISKDTRSKTFVQIKSNGKQEVSSSPILGETNYDNDNLSEINEI